MFSHFKSFSNKQQNHRLPEPPPGFYLAITRQFPQNQPIFTFVPYGYSLVPVQQDQKQYRYFGPPDVERAKMTWRDVLEMLRMGIIVEDEQLADNTIAPYMYIPALTRLVRAQIAPLFTFASQASAELLTLDDLNNCLDNLCIDGSVVSIEYALYTLRTEVVAIAQQVTPPVDFNIRATHLTPSTPTTSTPQQHTLSLESEPIPFFRSRTVRPTDQQLSQIIAPYQVRHRCTILYQWKLQYWNEYKAWFKTEMLKENPYWMDFMTNTASAPSDITSRWNQSTSHNNTLDNSNDAQHIVGRQSCPNNISQRNDPQGTLSTHHFRNRHRKW